MVTLACVALLIFLGKILRNLIENIREFDHCLLFCSLNAQLSLRKCPPAWSPRSKAWCSPFLLVY